jgi:hypothetical protein
MPRPREGATPPGHGLTSAAPPRSQDTYIVVVPLGDIIYTRLSAQIYLERSDFRRLGALAY